MTSRSASQPDKEPETLDRRIPDKHRPSRSSEAAEQPDPLDFDKIIEELRINQIELLLQNEKLRRTRDELETARNRFAELYNLAPVGYITLDHRIRIIEANLTTTRLLGLEHSQLIGRTLTSFLEKDSQDRFFANVQQFMGTRKEHSCDLKVRAANGKILYLRLTGNFVPPDPVTIVADDSDNTEPQNPSSSQQPCCRIILHDITEQKKMEIALRTAHDQWARTFEAISDPVAIIDPDMRILKANSAYSRLVGVRSEEIKGKFCFSIFRHRSETCDDCPVEEVLKTGQPATVEFTNEALRKALHISISPLMDDQNQPDGMVLIIRDVTRNKMMKKQLLQAQKLEAIGTLAGGIAHDFNNILTAIIGYARLGLIQLSEDVEQEKSQPLRYKKLRRYFEKIFASGNRAGKLVSQILTFSRWHEIVPKPMDPTPVIKESVKFLRASLPSTITFELSIPANLPLILADPTRINQVIINLATNAAHAMRSQGGTLKIALREQRLTTEKIAMDTVLKPGRYLELEITDTGHGMNEELICQIFDPFFTTKKKGEGTGLGLSVVHGIISQADGGIEVSSQPGRGSTFKVLIPIVPEEQGYTESSSLPETLTGGCERILLVDDEEVLLEMTREFLSLQGYEVVTCATGNEALGLFTADPHGFDLIVTDQTMPELTGSRLTEKILKIRPDLPVILTTGYSDTINKQQARQLGVRAFFHKPVVMEKLAAAIREILDNSNDRKDHAAEKRDGNPSSFI